MKEIITALLAFCLLLLFILITPGAPLPISTALKKQNEITSYGKKEIPQQSPEFHDQTLDANITFSHHQGDSSLTGLDEVLGAGACALDYDADGLIDLFLVNGSGQKQHWWQDRTGHALYKNLGNNQFEDVTARSGLTMQSWGMGCVSGDLDGNGYPDLLITNLGENSLLRNNGDGSFTDVTQQSGMSGNDWSTSAAIADYDNDGLLDIYIANYVNFHKGNKTYEPGSQFLQDIPMTFNAALYDAQANKLYRNLGNFKFQDTSDDSGSANPDGRSLGVMWGDLNNDRYPDIYISNDSGGGTNTLLINQGNGKFMKGDTQTNLSTAQGHQGIASGDIDNDGDIDLTVSGNNRQPRLLLINKQADDDSSDNVQFQDMSNTLGLSKKDFAGYSGWSSGLYDFNNDGWLDLLTVNGLITPDPDAHKIPQGQNKQLWLNRGDGSFSDATLHSGIALMDTHSARGSAFADFDNDGDIDVYIAHNNDLGQLLINHLPPSQNWVGIQLIGTGANRDAIGSKVWLNSETSHQSRQVTRGGGFQSSNDPRLHFGLGSIKGPVSLTVQWPDGERSTYNDIPLNRYLVINQSQPDIKSLAPPQILAKTETETETGLRLKIGVDQPMNRARYLGWLLTTQDASNSMDELEAALNDNSREVRLAAIALLAQYKTTDGLRLLIKSLSHVNSDERIAAIKAIRDYEQEESMRWLLRMFNDPSPDVRVAIAECFAFFFREEEAVVHRKRLAIPYLIRLLDDKHASVRIAAIRALGDAERYRAVAPLIAQLSDPDNGVKVAVTRALGMIREQAAIAPLLTLLQDPSLSENVMAQLLIALKRLNHSETPRLIEQFLYANSNSALQGLSVINSILTNNRDDDSVVFDRKMLLGMVERWFFNPAIHSALTEQANYGEVDSLVSEILINSGISASTRLTEHLLSASSEAIRAKIYQALIKQDAINRRKYTIAGLSDPSPVVRKITLEIAMTHHLGLPMELLIDALTDKETMLAAIGALSRIPDDIVITRLNAISINDTMPLDARVASLTALANMSADLPALPTELYNHDDARIRAAALHYWHQHESSSIRNEKLPALIDHALHDDSAEVKNSAINVLLDSREPWARQTITALLSRTDLNPTIHTHIINSLMNAKIAYASTILIKVTETHDAPMRKAALKQLVSVDTPLVEKLMWRLLKDSAEETTIRLLAAEALLSKNSQQVIDVLRGSSMTPKT